MHSFKSNDDLSARAWLVGSQTATPGDAEKDAGCTLCPVYGKMCCGIAKSISKKQVSDLEPEKPFRAIAARSLIIHPKEYVDYVPILCSGWALSSMNLSNGRRQIMSFLLPGDILTVTGLAGPSMGVGVEAITDVKYKLFNVKAIRQHFYATADSLDYFFAYFSDEKSKSHQLALDLGRRTARERLARLLLRIESKLFKRGLTASKTFHFPLRHQHIADATGLTPVHVSKTLGDMQREGIVTLVNRKVTILSLDRLRLLAEM